MKFWKILIIFMGFLIILCLNGCASTEKEQKYVSIENPEKYYVLEGETYTYYDGTSDKAETGTFIKNDDETSISFLNSETNDTRTYEFRGNFFGSYLFDLDKSEVYDNGKKFKFERDYDAEPFTVAGISFDLSQRYKFELDGTVVGYMYMNGNYLVGTYTVDGNIVNVIGVEGAEKETMRDTTIMFYYNNYEFFSGSTYVKEK